MAVFSMTNILVQKLACYILNKCTCHRNNCHMAPATRANKNCDRKNCSCNLDLVHTAHYERGELNSV